MGRIFLGNIKGPKGDTGEKGDQGPQGNIGPVGPAGIIDGNTPIEFTEAESYVNIESGESIAIGFGKIRKIISGILNGAISSLLGKNFSANKVLISDTNGKASESSVLKSELETLAGAKKNIQEQIGDLTTLPTTNKTSLVGAVSELNGKMTDPVKAVVLNLSSTTFAANTYGEATAEVASVVPEGYTALTAIPRHSMNANLVWTMCSYASGTVTARLRNLSSSAVTAAPTVVVLCVLI